MGPERALAAAEKVEIDASGLPLRGAVGLEVDAERQVGSQPEGAGEGAALGFQRLGFDLYRPRRAGVEIHVHEVAGMGQAGGMDLPPLALALAQDPKLARDVVEPRPLGEGRQGPQRELHGADVEGHRQPARGRALRRQARPAHHQDLHGLEFRDLQPPVHQGAVVPGDIEIVGLEPDAVLVGDGQPPDGEIAPDVAAQAFDLQLAHRPQHQPGHPRLDQEPCARRQGAIAQRHHAQDRQERRSPHRRRRPAEGRAGLQPPASGGRGRGLAQKLCPMLT